MPNPYYTADGITLHLGNSLDILPTLPDASIDAVICDPPYGLSELPATTVTKAIAAWLAGDRTHVPNGKGFMGKDWDRFVPPPGLWDECFRVLKPGGHLAAFAGSRTVDLMGLSIRLAGFELRESLMWLHGQGFPKSLDVSKAIDKAAGHGREDVRHVGFRVFGAGSPACAACGKSTGSQPGNCRCVDVKASPVTDDAARWQGWGTALKPAHEPIVLARKPLAGTVAANVLTHGTGALNIDGCRVAAAPGDYDHPGNEGIRDTTQVYGQWAHRNQAPPHRAGRWPTNVILTHPPLLDEDGQPIGDACADGCIDGGELTLRVYGDDRGDLVLGVSTESLLDRLQALLGDLRASSRSGTTLWPGASAFYRNEDTESSGESADRSLRDAVESALRQSVVPGSPAGCQSCRDSDDGRVRRVLEAAQAGLPSLLDALDHEIRRIGTPAHSRLGQRCARQSSSDGLPCVAPSSCSCPSSTCDGSPSSLLGIGTPRRSPDTESRASRLAGPGGSTLSSSTASPCDRSGTADHSVCRYATVRLLTLLTFDLAARFVVPNPGVYAREVAFSPPQCPVAEMDRQSGVSVSKRSSQGAGWTPSPVYGSGDPRYESVRGHDDAGGASRFFPVFRYEAKAPARERPRLPDGTAHPTVKPLALMRWLVRLVTPPGGTVLDPFAGSGTTLEACAIEGAQALGIELDELHAALCKVRLTKSIEGTLFGDVA